MNNGKICVSVCSETAEKMRAKIDLAQEFADIVEVRFDCLRSEFVDGILNDISNGRSGKPVLFTFRSRDQGGLREIDFSERLTFWEKVLNRPPLGSLIDIEAEPRMALAVQTTEIPRIVSQHDFTGTPRDLDAKFDAFVLAFDPDIVKIASTASDITDTIPIWKLIERAHKAGKQIIPIAMGEAGKWTRILGLAHGAFLTYASLDAGVETAPGQVTAKQLTDLYRVKDLDRDTKVFGILGDPVSQSLSTFMHNPAFVSEGFNGVFIPFLVKDIGAFIQRMVRPETREVELNFGGFSVTMPHKQSIMEYLDKIEPTAAKIGAVNTVKVNEDGNLIGYNTDAHGFITPLKAKYGDLKGAKAAVFGAGGAARACVYALQQEGVDVKVFVRDPEKSEAFAEEFNMPLFEISNFKSEISDAKDEDQRSKIKGPKPDIIVDTTPLGMAGALENESLLTSDELKGIKFVYDLVTRPFDTPIIRYAKQAGIPAIGGLEMLVAQGAEQFKIWTGKDAPVQQMKESVLRRFAEINK